MQWFRFYNNALHDPALHALDSDTFKGWVFLLCLASQHDEGGRLPPMREIAFALRCSEDAAVLLTSCLKDAGLLVGVQGGRVDERLAVADWDKRQYKSDSSTPRAQRSKQRSKEQANTRSRTEQNRAEQKPPTPTDEIEQEADLENDPPQEPDSSSGKSYAFEGKVVRLNRKDFDQWAATYHAIPDLRAELMSIDAWFQAPENAKAQGKWFHAASSMLNRKHQEELRKATAAKQGSSLQEIIRERHRREQAAKGNTP